MKKRFINDFYTFIALTISCVWWFAFWIIYNISISDKLLPTHSVVIGNLVFGVFFVGSLLTLLFTTEIIMFEEDRILCRKIFKSVEMTCAQVVDIQETKRTILDNATAPALKITDDSGKSICMVLTKRRKKYLDCMMKK